MKAVHGTETRPDKIGDCLTVFTEAGLAKVHGALGLNRLYVGAIPDANRNDPALVEWAKNISDPGERTNALARINGGEPLGIARTLPPVPAALATMFGTDVMGQRGVAMLGTLLSTSKPLSAQDIADVMQRDYHLDMSSKGASIYLRKMADPGVGLAKTVHKEGHGPLFTAVVPADKGVVTAEEREALRGWARKTLNGQAQADALTRIDGTEPLERSKQLCDGEPITRAQFTTMDCASSNSTTSSANSSAQRLTGNHTPPVNIDISTAAKIKISNTPTSASSASTATPVPPSPTIITKARGL
ncbi:hypothetical protein FKR81_41780 [Lentzea tibetensis]|uniref:Uncharacterized protein n=1 Tax=Lentzea tibetensis TaxID=2591470 RepID=A0A563EF24_9PSEU|nr:hypothetical protein [Lentzea tibetensis]TWP44018.1 hypothetical protein FKR81_41780 [Lentzea tibetensis]